MKQRLWSLVVLVLVAGGCEDQPELAGESAARSAAYGVAEPSDPGPPDVPPQEEAGERLLVRTAEIGVDVTDMDAAAARIRELADRVEGRVDGLEQVSDRGQARWSRVQLRVPERRLEEAVQAISELGKVERTRISERDVTGEAEDLRLRLRNLNRLEDWLLRLLEEGAGKSEEVLAAQQELASVRAEIVRREDRLRRLEDEAAWSMLRVQIHERHPITARASDGLGARIFAASIQTWRNFLNGVLGLMVVLGFIGPMALIAGTGVWLYRRFVPRRPVRTPAE